MFTYILICEERMESNATVIIVTSSILVIGALVRLYLYNLQVSKPANEVIAPVVSELIESSKVQMVRDFIDPSIVAEEATGGFLYWLTDLTIAAINTGAIVEPYYGVALGLFLSAPVIKSVVNIKLYSELKPSSKFKLGVFNSQIKLSCLSLMVVGGTPDSSVDNASEEGSSSLERVPSPSDSQVQVSTALLFTPPRIQASKSSVPSPAHSLAYICSQGGEDSSSSSKPGNTAQGFSGAFVVEGPSWDSTFEGSPGVSQFQEFAGRLAFQKFVEFLAAQEFAVQECIIQKSYCAARHESGIVFAYAHSILYELKNALDSFDAMLSSDGMTGIPANVVNVKLWTVARADVQKFADEIRFAEGNLIDFERQNRATRRWSYNGEKRKWVEALNKRFSVLPRTPLKALANIANDIKNYEARKNSKPFFFGIDLDNFIKLYKQNAR